MIVYASVLIVIVGAFFANNIFLSSKLLREQLDQTLEADSNYLMEAFDLGGIVQVTELLKVLVTKVQREEVVYLLTDDRYKPVVGNISVWPTNFPKDISIGEVDRVLEYDDERDIRYIHIELDNRYHLLIGRETVKLESLKNHILFFTTVFASILLLSGVVCGLILHWRISRKLQPIVTQCEFIRNGDLTARFPVESPGDEIDRMVETLNATLDQVQELMEDVQCTTNNIAHDLKTPLTRVRNRLENLLLSTKRRERVDEISSAIEELDALAITFSSILKLSQLEMKRSHFVLTETCLSDVVEDAVSFYRDSVEQVDGEIVCSVERDVYIEGDKSLLFGALGNLIQNYISHGDPNTTLNVTLNTEPDSVVIEVCDEGPGIPAEEIHNIAKRFYRLDKSRKNQGNGLGLTLVNATVSLHGGTVEFSNREGLCVTLRFPKAACSDAVCADPKGGGAELL